MTEFSGVLTPTNKYPEIIAAPPVYAGSVGYYAALVRHSAWCVTADEPYNDMWAINRCRIITANGVQTLTIPLEKPEKGRRTPIKDLRISNHGKWEHLHWGAIFSAYGKAPFFEYAEYDLKHIYENRTSWLIDFNQALHNFIVDFMQIEISSSLSDTHNEEIITMPRLLLSNKNIELYRNDVDSPLRYQVSPYYQVWQSKYGFVAGLSILDMLLNEGPQGLLHLLNR